MSKFNSEFLVIHTLCCCSVDKSCVTLCDPMDCSLPGSLSMGFSRQEHWCRLPFSFSRESSWPTPPALTGRFLTTKPPAAKSLQSCPTLCDLIPGILQARTLEWVAISFSNKHFKQASLVFGKLLLQNQPVFLRSLRIPMSGTPNLKSNFATPGNNWQCVESFWSSFVSLSSLFCSTDKSIYSRASTTFS